MTEQTPEAGKPRGSLAALFAVLAFIAVGLGVVSAILFGLDKGPYLTTNLSVYDFLASIGLLAGAVLIMRVVMEALDSDTRASSKY